MLLEMAELEARVLLATLAGLERMSLAKKVLHSALGLWVGVHLASGLVWEVHLEHGLCSVFFCPWHVCLKLLSFHAPVSVGDLACCWSFLVQVGVLQDCQDCQSSRIRSRSSEVSTNPQTLA